MVYALGEFLNCDFLPSPERGTGDLSDSLPRVDLMGFLKANYKSVRAPLRLYPLGVSHSLASP